MCLGLNLPCCFLFSVPFYLYYFLLSCPLLDYFLGLYFTCTVGSPIHFFGVFFQRLHWDLKYASSVDHNKPLITNTPSVMEASDNSKPPALLSFPELPRPEVLLPRVLSQYGTSALNSYFFKCWKYEAFCASLHVCHFQHFHPSVQIWDSVWSHSPLPKSSLWCLLQRRAVGAEASLLSFAWRSFRFTSISEYLLNTTPGWQLWLSLSALWRGRSSAAACAVQMGRLPSFLILPHRLQCGSHPRGCFYVSSLLLVLGKLVMMCFGTLYVCVFTLWSLASSISEFLAFIVFGRF